jgi:hypothetical protein
MDAHARAKAPLDGPAIQAEVPRGLNHLTVAGPHVPFANLVRSRQMNRNGSA